MEITLKHETGCFALMWWGLEKSQHRGIPQPVALKMSSWWTWPAAWGVKEQLAGRQTMGLDPELLALFHEIEHCGVESVFRVGCLSQAPLGFCQNDTRDRDWTGDMAAKTDLHESDCRTLQFLEVAFHWMTIKVTQRPEWPSPQAWPHADWGWHVGLLPVA